MKLLSYSNLKSITISMTNSSSNNLSLTLLAKQFNMLKNSFMKAKEITEQHQFQFKKTKNQF